MKKNTQINTHLIFGLNNSIEIFKSEKVNLDSIYLLKDGQASKNKFILDCIKKYRNI